MDSYVQGFIDKCAEFGMDPEKVAQSFPGANDPKLWPGAPWQLPMEGYGLAEPGAHGTWRVDAHNQGVQQQGVQRRLAKSVAAKPAPAPALPQQRAPEQALVQGGRRYSRQLNPTSVLQFSPGTGRYNNIAARPSAGA